MGWVRPGILKFLPSPTVVPRNELRETISMLSADAVVVDLGAGGRRIHPNVVTIDAVSAPGVDVVGDIHRIPLATESVDCIICTGTLEHVRDPRKALNEFYRILRHGGILHIDVPFIQGYHPDPTDYWRFTLDGLRLLCREFEELAAGVHIGPTSAWVWITREWANSLSSNRWLSNLFLVPVAFLTAPLRYIDYLVIRCQRSHHVASAVYFRGIKNGLKKEGTGAS